MNAARREFAELLAPLTEMEKGMSIENRPPSVCEFELANQNAAAVLTSMVVVAAGMETLLAPWN